jgi:hypothetical protein
MMVCLLLFNFATSFDFGCFSLSQEMSFVDHYLPYFKQWLITHLLPALLPFQSLFMQRSAPWSPPPFFGVLTAHHPLCCMFLFSYLFIIQLGFFWGAGVSLSMGLCWFIPGVAVGILYDAYLLTCWSASPKQVWSRHLAA